MARPTLEVTRFQTLLLAGTTTAASLALGGPTGIKPLVTIIGSGIGSATGLTNVVVRTGAATTACTRIGLMTLDTRFVDLWTAANVSIEATTVLDVYGTASGFISIESGYWDAIAVSTLLAAGPVAGALIGGYVPPGYAFAPGTLTGDDLVYGVMQGTPGSLPADPAIWTLAGGPTMEAPLEYGVIPPTFTNDQDIGQGISVGAGDPAQTATGFVREPVSEGVPFAFDFEDVTTWRLYLLKLTGPESAPGVAIPARLATIVG